MAMRLIWGAIGTLMLAAVVMLVPAVQQAGARDGGGPGPGGGGAGPQRQTIVIFPGSSNNEVALQLLKIRDNPNVEFKLRVPNAPRAASAPLVYLFRTGSGARHSEIYFVVKAFMSKDFDHVRNYARRKFNQTTETLEFAERRLKRLHPLNDVTEYVEALLHVSELKARLDAYRRLRNAVPE